MCTHIYVYIYACIYTLNSSRGSQQRQPHHRKQPHATSAPRASSLAAPGLSAAGTCHDGLEAALALGGVLPSGALVAQDLVVLGHEGLIGQGAEALGAAEAGVVPVAVLVVHLLGTKQGAGRRERGVPSRRHGPSHQSPSGRAGAPSRSTLSPARPRGRYLGVGADGLAALHARVGAELVEALEAAVVAVLLHVLLSLQVVPAVVAVEFLSHGAHLVAGGTCGGRAGGTNDQREGWSVARGALGRPPRDPGDRRFTVTPATKAPRGESLGPRERESCWAVPTQCCLTEDTGGGGQGFWRARGPKWWGE